METDPISPAERARGDRLLRAAAVHRPVLVALMVAIAVVALVAGLLLPGALADAVDAAVGGELRWSVLVWPLLLGAAEIMAEVVGVIVTASVTTSVTAWLRHRITRRLVELGTTSPFAEGDAVSRVTGDSTGAGTVASLVVQLVSGLGLSAGAIVLLGLLDWRLAVVFVASLPLAVWLGRAHLRRTAADVTAYQEVSGELAARLLDAASGLRTIRAAGIADREAQRVLRPLPSLHAAGVGMWRSQARMVWRAGLLLPTVQLGVLLTAGFGVLAGRISVGDVLAALSYTMLGTGLVGQVSLLTALSQARACARRIAAVLHNPAPEDGVEDLPCGPGRVELRGVRLAGSLAGVDVDIAGGTSVAVVGQSGAGKSALLRVLCGLRQQDSGEVLLDGVPLSSVPRHQLRGAVGYAHARPALLGSSVADAVAYGSSADRTAIERACRAARIHDPVARLPDGCETALESTPLSGGEAQRLGLARALVRGPRVLLLDEATSSLDTVTEREVLSGIDELLPSSTRIIVTSSAGMAREADRVLWLRDGEVRAFAPHAELRAWQEYRALFAAEPDVAAPGL